ncbi:MAG: flagellar filament capping protein FliD [Acidimicrobiales bacterium]
MSYIDGMASGLDTSSIIRQLMQVEAIPQTLLKSKVNTVQTGLDAFASIRTRMAAARTAADAIGQPANWQALTSTSSHPDKVGVAATSGSLASSTTFTVSSLAAAQQQSSEDRFTGLDATLDGRTMSITKGTHTFESTAGTLRELVAEINADSDLGVRASTLQVSPGEYRLVLTSTESGEANGFDVASSGWTPFQTTVAASDAVLDIGGITVTRPTNTISDLIDGATLTLKAVTTEPVTVGVTRDVQGITDKVKAMVTAVNSVLSEIKTRTAFDAESGKRSSLTGDSTVRSLAQRLTGALTGAVGNNPLGSVGLAGIEIKRDGSVAFDEAKFKAAYENDPVAVEGLFLGGATSTGPVTFERAGWRAQPGTYDIDVVDNGDGTFAATIGGHSADVSVRADGSLRLTVAATNERLGGMTVVVAAGETGAVGAITYEPGAAKRVSTMTNRSLDTVSGQLTSAENSRKAQIRDLNRQIESWEIRLEKRELGLRRQYTGLETMLGQLGSQAQWLSGQLAGLQANRL